MKFFKPEPPINLYKDGFDEKKDILGRAIIGQSLSDLVERIDNSLVIALEGGWGSGKTYFLQRWVGAHCLQNKGRARTIYFDAFTNDYISDPLPALVSALGERVAAETKDTGTTMQALKEASFRAAKPAARMALALAVSGLTEIIGSALGDASVKAAEKEASKALDTYWKQEEGRRAAMKDFRGRLEELVNALPDRESTTEQTEKEDKPRGAKLVIVIDELDRCRPDYALEVLEIIKHFFDVDGVIFVLGTNLTALEHSVKARYGAGIDASAYLRKFINESMSLPTEVPSYDSSKDVVLKYLEACLSDMDVPKRFSAPLGPHLKIVARKNKVSLRDVEKILTSLSLLRKEVNNAVLAEGPIEMLITLLVSKIVNPDVHQKFLHSTITPQELEDYFDATENRRNRKLGDVSNTLSLYQDCFAYGVWMYYLHEEQFKIDYPQIWIDMSQTYFAEFLPISLTPAPLFLNARHIDPFLKAYEWDKDLNNFV